MSDLPDVWECGHADAAQWGPRLPRVWDAIQGGIEAAGGAETVTDEQIDAIAKTGANAFAQDVHGRSGFDNVLDESGYYAAEEPEEGNVYVEEIWPEWVRISRGIVEATLKAVKSEK